MECFVYYQSLLEKNIRSHTESSVKRHEPMILKLTSSYNDLCHQLTGLLASSQALPGSAAPQPIQCDGLFKLNVDDDIWQDVELDDEDAGRIPRILADQEGCSEIQAF